MLESIMCTVLGNATQLWAAAWHLLVKSKVFAAAFARWR
jgi:hypothetical protein